MIEITPNATDHPGCKMETSPWDLVHLFEKLFEKILKLFEAPNIVINGEAIQFILCSNVV